MQIRAKTSASGAVPRTVRRSSCAWRRPTARQSSSTIARTLPCMAGAAGVHVGPGRSAAGRRACGCSAPAAIVGCLDPHRRADRGGAPRAGQLHRRRAGVRHHDEGHRLRGRRARSRLDRGAAGGRDCRSSRSAESRSRQRVGARGRRDIGGGHRRSADARAIRKDAWQRICSVSRNIAYSPGRCGHQDISDIS